MVAARTNCLFASFMKVLSPIVGSKFTSISFSLPLSSFSHPSTQIQHPAPTATLHDAGPQRIA
eukprot:scaffold316_cov122-Skeletonema_dohrnii-CCMP3373.AAC.6